MFDLKKMTVEQLNGHLADVTEIINRPLSDDVLGHPRISRLIMREKLRKTELKLKEELDLRNDQ